MTRRAVVVAGLYAFLGGILSFAGWMLDIPRLTDWFNKGISIQPNASVCVISSALGILFLAANRDRFAAVCGAIVLLIGSSTLVQWVTGLSFGIDSLLLFGREWGRLGVVYAGRMGLAGSLSWTLLGTALILSAFPPQLRRWASALGLTAAAISALSLVGYLYDVDTFYAVPQYTVIALQTTSFIMAVSIGIILSHPDREPMRMLTDPGSAGLFARRALPLLLFVPILLGLLRVRGQVAGLYGTALGTAGLVLALIVFLVTLVWRSLATLRERERHEREYAQRRLRDQQTFVELIERCPFGVYIVDADFRIAHMNTGSQTGAFANVRPVIGRPFDEAVRILWPEPVAADVVQIFRRTLETGVSYHSSDFVQPRADKDAVEGYEWDLHQIKMPDGRPAVVCYYYDSTVLRQTQAAVRSASDELRQTLNTSAIGLTRCDRDLRYVSVNKAYAEIAGLPVDQIVGRTVAEVKGVDTFEKLRPRIERVLAGERVEFESRLAWPRGSARWIHFTYTPWVEPDDTVTGWVASVLDITARKQAEEALRQSEADLSHELRRMSRVQALSTRMAAVSDLQSLLREILAASTELTGTDKGNIQLFDSDSNNLRIVVHQGHGRRFIEHFAEHGWSAACDAASEQGRRIIVEDVANEPSVQGTLGLEIVLEDGIRALQSTPLLTRDGRLLGMLNNHFGQVHRPSNADLRYLDLLARMAADFIERAQTEQALRESEQRLTYELAATIRLHGLSSRLISATELSSGLGDVLDSAIETCGADFGNIQLLQAQSGTLEIVAQRGFQPDFLDYFRTVQADEGSACARAMQSGARVTIEDVELEPSYRPHLSIAASTGYRAVTSTPLNAHDGAMVGMLSVHFRTPHRVSERDARLLDLYARHAADLFERLRFLQALQDADRRKDEFLATLAHELRNPLAPIRHSLAMLKDTTDTTTSVRARQMMERQVNHMVRLIDDLLDVSRISRGKLVLRKECVDLATIAHDAIEACRPMADLAGHKITVTIPSQPIFVDADPIRLTQVFSNLLNNACKFTREAGLISFTVVEQRDDVVVAVRDNGIGIPPDELDSVFGLFTQLDRTLEKSHSGLGIGLTLVKQLAELHGGSVEARSDGPGRGSEFVVRLPIMREKQSSPEAPTKDSAGSSSTRRILVVDDNRDGAESLAMLLDLAGHETHLAFDGEEAVEMARRHRPDVILLDIGLPKLNGYEACRRIKERASVQSIIIALTGWGQDEDRRKSAEAGFDGHLVKPVDYGALLELLAAHTRQVKTDLGMQ